jgi:pyruvate,water dikinase
VEQFVRLLDYYGQDPIIVRSSSILEDGCGNAFAGKYESVFLANAGSMEERLAAFEDAVRTVYASTMSLSALDYRKRRGLAKRDEQMALLVQRVSGSHYGRYVLPFAAGVGYSKSPYRFLREMDPNAGMLRLVMGLGTMAVDRVEGSYPRIVSLDRPEVSAASTEAERHQYSQKRIAVMDAKTCSLREVFLEELLPVLPDHLKKALLAHDREAERFSGRAEEAGRCTISPAGD